MSYAYGVPVAELLGQRLAVTVPLALIAFVLSTLIAIPLGMFAAVRHNTAGDYAVMGFSQIGMAVPNFWFAILLILFFAVQLGWFSAGGFAGWDAGVGAALKSLLLPALALAVTEAAILARVTRSAVLETLREDYVRTARAKGLSNRAVLWGHVFRNALIPVTTIMGLQFAFLIAGAVIVENVFYLPGLGRLVFQAISNRDVIVVKDIVVFLAALVVIVNFVVDLVYMAIDPRPKRPADPCAGGVRQALRHRNLAIGAVLTGASGACRRAVAVLDAATTRPPSTSPTSCRGQRRALVRHRPVRTRHPVDDHGRRPQLHRRRRGRGRHRPGRGRAAGIVGGHAARRGRRAPDAGHRPDLRLSGRADRDHDHRAGRARRGQCDHRDRDLQHRGVRAGRARRRAAGAGAALHPGGRRDRPDAGGHRAPHVLPNMGAVLIVQATIQFAVAILAEAGLSYLGLGVQPPAPSWGKMLNDAQTLIFLHPSQAIYPGLAIALSVLGLNLLGDGLRDVLDPRLRLWRAV